MLEHRDRTVVAIESGNRHSRSWIALMALVSLLLAQPAWSQATCFWNQNGPGQWDVPANWNGCSGGNGTPAGTPGPADHAVIGNIAPLADIDLGASAHTVDHMTLSAGRIFGDSDMVIASRLDWTGGTIDGGGGATQLVLNPGSNSEISGSLHVLAKRDLRIFGTLTWVEGDIELREDAEIDIQGPFVVDYSGGVRAIDGGGAPLELRSDLSPLARIHNSSTVGARIEKLGDAIVRFAGNVTFDNGNDVLVNDGTLQIYGPGGDFGAYQIASIARLEFGNDPGVTRDLTGTTAVAGSGVLHKFGDGTLNITGGFALTGPLEVVDGLLYIDSAVDPLSLTDLLVRLPGVFSSPDNLVVTGALTWIGGEINGTSAGLTLTLPAAATATVPLDDAHGEATLRSRDLINQGTVLISGTGTSPFSHRFILDSAGIDNQGDFELRANNQNNLVLDCATPDCGSFFNRAGATVRLNDLQGIPVIGPELTAFNNDGLVDLVAGCGQINAPGVDTGTYRYDSNCTLAFFTRPDTERTFQSAVVLDPLNSTTLQLGGSLRVSGAARSFGNLIIDNSATLFGSAPIIFTGITEWRGLIEGFKGQTVTVALGATLQTNSEPSDTPLLFGRILFNNGDINITNVRLQLDGDAEIRNSGLLNLFGTPIAAGAIGCATPPLCGLITNTSAGSIQSVAVNAGPITQLEPDISVVNQGTLVVDNGVLALEGPFSAAAGSIVDVRVGAGLRRTAGNLVLAAGTLRGAGVIDADVDVDAVNIQPANTAPGNLSILGNFTATSNTSYAMGIAGTLPPAVSRLGERPAQPAGVPTYDRLTIAGNATLAGTLDVVDLGYAATGGDVFDLMLYASRNGNVIAGTNPYSGVGLNLQTEATRIRLAGAAGGGCEWIGGSGNWTVPANWSNCSGGVGPGPGPAGTPGAPDTAIIGGGSNVNLDVPVTVAALQFTGGSIGGPNNLSISSDLIWTGGSFQGTSGTLVTLSAGANGTLSGGQHSIDGRTFVLQAPANWTTGLIQLVNGGVLEITVDGVLNSNPSLAFESIFGSGSGTPEVRNNGTINKLGPNYSGIGQSVQYSGSGNINVTSGDFTFAATSVAALNGSFLAAAGSTLQFVGGNRTFGSSATLDGGNLVFGDSSPVAGINVVDACIGSASTVIIRNAELVLNCASPSDLAVLQIAEPLAVLEGSSAIRVTGTFVWSYGTIRGTGLGQTFEIGPGAVAQFDSPSGQAPRILSNRRLRNDGTINWVAPGTTEINDTAEFTNESGGQLILGSGGSRNVTSNAPTTSRLINNGTLSVLDGTQGDVDVGFDNAGAVQLVAGELHVRRDGNDLGSYAMAAGTILYFDGATRSMGPVSDVSGAGAVRVIGGASLTTNGTFQPHDLRIESSGAVQIDSASPQLIQTLYLQGGTLTGNTEVRIGTWFDWRHAGVVASTGGSPGPLVIQSGAMLYMCSGLCTLSNRVLRIEGMADWGGGEIQVPTGESGKIVVALGGTLQMTSIKSSVRYRCSAPTCTAEMEVEGSLLQLGDGADLLLTSPLLLNGGTLQIDGNAVQVPGVTMSAGLIELINGDLIADPVLLNGGVLRGDGAINGSVTNVAGRVQPGASPGRLDILLSYTQGPSGILDIEVGGLAPGISSDFLFVSDAASIDGTLNVTNAGYALTAPSTLDILHSNASLSGTFAVTNIAYPGYEVTYDSLTATLTPGGGPLVVNSFGDAGDGICDISECTLRDALIAANLMPDPDDITFNIPGPCTGPGGACVIQPLSALPTITTPILIDGYSQPGAVANSHPQSLGLGNNAVLQIELSGALAGGGAGLVINAPSSLVTVKGIAFHGWNAGIVTQGPGDANYLIGGNYFGIRADGSVAPGVQLAGIAIQGGSVFIGNGTAAEMNVISGNQQQGIAITALPSLAAMAVVGNLIGTERDGQTARANGQQGILFNTAGEIRNVVIGGNLPDERNVISGNTQDGIRFNCTATGGNCFDGTRVIGNFIGPAADGGVLGNVGNGVNLAAMDFGRVYIGTVNPGEGNRIAFNGGNGILATFGGTGRASFLRNDIYSNGQLGIDLGGDGRTNNDAGDVDTGPNGRLNFPTFTAYSAPGGNSAVIDVVLNTPDIGGNYPAIVDFYKAVADEPGVWLGATLCSAPAVTCMASFAFPGGVTVTPDDVVLGVVTDGFGKSSEASFYPSATLIQSDTPDPTPIGSSYSVTVQVSSTSPFTPIGTVDVSDGAGQTCQATLSSLGPSLAGGSCLLNSAAPTGIRTLAANYTQAGTAVPFIDSSDTDTHTVILGTAPLVNSVADPGNGTCDVAECTLREAIALANSTMAPAVNFDSVFFGVPRTITLTAGELRPTQSVNLVGPGAALLNIAGNNSTRLFDASSVGLAISGATLSAGNAAGSFNNGFGGAIHQVGGSLTLTDVVLSGNACSGTGAGGALVFLNNAVNLTRTTISGNACDTASAISIENSSVTIVDSTLSGNNGITGAALILRASTAAASLDLTNVTISGNTSVSGNSAIQSQPFAGRTTSINLTNSTVTGNTTSNVGGNGAIFHGFTGGTHLTVLRNSIIAGNTVGGVANDFQGSADPGSAFNVIGTGGGLVNGVNGNQVGVNAPLLAPLANYGGPTATHALLPGSPAINSGSDALAPAFDQRGIVRPQQASADVGAFESRGFTLSLVSGTPQTTPFGTAFAQPLVVAVAPNAAGEPVNGGRVVYAVPGAGASAVIVNPVVIAAGQASATATANAILGSYDVAPVAAGATGAVLFALTNGVRATATAISGIAPTTSVVGQPYAVTVAVTDAGTPLSSGMVEVRQLSNGSTCLIDLSLASACQLVSPSAITTAVRATFLGGSGYASSASAVTPHVVARADTAIVIVDDTPDPSAAGQPITITVSLAVVAPGAGAPTGDILVTDGTASCGITLPNLSCVLAPKAVGLATLEARYLGDADFNPSVDTEPHTFAADGADLAIVKGNGLRLLPGGMPSTYILLVTNAGPQAVVNARVTDILPAQFSGASWTCSASPNASCPASGSGTVDALVSMAAGASVTFALTATVQATPEQVVTNRATVTPPANAPDPAMQNNESVDIDEIGIFGEGFETENE